MDNQFEDSSAIKSPFNYLFFLLFFSALALIHTLHITLVEPSFTLSKHFFLMYGIGQCVMQVLMYLSLFMWLKTFAPRVIMKIIIALGCLFVVCEVIDFLMERLLDISIWYAIGFILQESKGNFIELLKASNVSLGIWALVFFGGALLVVVGLLVFHLTEKLSSYRPLYFSKRLMLSCAAASLLFLCVWDKVFSPFAMDGPSRRYEKALPWKTTLFPPKKQELLIGGSLRRPWMDNDFASQLDSSAFALQRKPDIFLFVTESLREDYITDQIAPSLSQFRDQSIHFSKAFSNANATHVSWFSLFYSLFPFYYANYQTDQWDKGSVPLALLKKMGYEIHLYSASRLKYYNMDEVLFGKGCHLLTSQRVYPQQKNIEPHQADSEAIQDLCKDIQKSDRAGGRVFIVFLDSTHFGYSWPKEYIAPFSPYDDKINYINAAVSSKNITKIKNRYRNAIHYVDSLFGQFIDTLKRRELWQDAVVIFTADHGEEFYENGHLFHASELSLQQTHVPLYLKMGAGKAYDKVSSDILSSHMDIFPSIFHYILGEDHYKDVFQGHSIFDKKVWPYVVSGRYNAGRSPYEFCIQKPSQKLLLQFDNKEDIFRSRSLNIIGVKSHSEEDIPLSLSGIHDHFADALDQLFSP